MSNIPNMIKYASFKTASIVAFVSVEKRKQLYTLKVTHLLTCLVVP